MRRPTVIAALVVAIAVGSAAVTVASSTSGKRQLRVAWVSFAGATTTAIGGDTYSGFVRAVKEFGWQGGVREVGPNVDPRTAVAYFVHRRYDLIVFAVLFPNAERYISSVANQFPGIRFLVPDLDLTKIPGRPPPNLHVYVFRVEEASYLAGYLAALMESRRAGKHVVSSVGGEPEPQLDPFIAGYQEGAKEADPHVTTLNDYSHDFVAPRKCRTVALGQIARGSGVVFDVAGACGLGALQAAKEKGVWGIGVDTDMSSLGPYILTSVLKREGFALYKELRAFRDGRLAPSGTTSLGLPDAVGLGRFSPRVPRSVLRQVDAVRRRIVAGEIKVPARLNR